MVDGHNEHQPMDLRLPMASLGFQTKPEIISSGSLAFQNTSPVAGMIMCTRKVQGIMGILLGCEWDIMRLTTVIYIYIIIIYIYI